MNFMNYVTQIGSRSSVYSPESSVRKTGSYIYEEFMPTDGTDVKVMFSKLTVHYEKPQRTCETTGL